MASNTDLRSAKSKAPPTELGGRNITVNAVAPGPVPTEPFLKGKTEAQINEFKKMPPLERLGRPEDIPGLVCHFWLGQTADG
jgi:NAD(P)-dependent dehydrogenase (short-subunit alcohol dehydrogenase family)